MADDKNKFITNINFRVLLRHRHKAKQARRKGYQYTDSDNVNFGLFHSLCLQSQLVDYFPNATQRADSEAWSPIFKVLYPDSDGNGQILYRRKSMDSIFDSDWVNNPMMRWLPFVPYKDNYNELANEHVFWIDSDTGNSVDMYNASTDSELHKREVQFVLDKVLSTGGVDNKIITVSMDIFQSLFFKSSGSTALTFPKLRTDLQPRYRSGETHYTHAHKFGDDSEGVGLSEEFKTKWKTENTDAWNFDSDTNTDLISVVKKLKNSKYYHGSLNGLALLALICGVPTTVYIPNSATLSEEQKAMRKILKNNGASIQAQENFLQSSQPMDFGDNL
jgi:hypothetical protein|tara:strand:+ start:31616 stop:32614 length:999 start_codon:yes stop_codon:yes gene_type:complete